MLEYGDPIYLLGPSRQTESRRLHSAPRKCPSSLYQCRARELDCVSETWRHGSLCAELLSHLFSFGFAGDIGDYHCSTRPDQPIVIHMLKTPVPARTSGARPASHGPDLRTVYHRVRNYRAENSRAAWPRHLGPGGFDPARDIATITVNRWPHGYAYEYNSLWDKFWMEGGELPCEGGPQAFWPDSDRERRRGRLRLCRWRD